MKLSDYLKTKKRDLKLFLTSVVALCSHRVGFKKQEYDYWQTYAEDSASNELGGCLIAMFDGRQIHCGLTDRFKGICTAYEFSKEFGLRFYLNYIHPFDLTDYLIPNYYDWKVDRRKILYNKNTSVPVFLNDWQSEVSFHRMYLKKIIKENPGKQIHLYINSPYYLNKYRMNYENLFKPSASLQTAIDRQADLLGEGYVAMSFRFLQLLGDFTEKHAFFPVLGESEQKELMRACEEKVLELRKEHHISSRLLLTADSSTFLDYMRSRHDFVYAIPGNVAHIDNDWDMDNSVYLKTFLDMYMLSRASRIYQLCTGEMYKNSAFARQAAMLGGVEYVKVEF